jgi:hypothetical protein
MRLNEIESDGMRLNEEGPFFIEGPFRGKK